MSKISKHAVTKYIEEFKQSSANLAAESKQSVSRTAEELGISPSTLHGWVRKYHPNHSHVTGQSIDFESENKRLIQPLVIVKFIASNIYPTRTEMRMTGMGWVR